MSKINTMLNYAYDIKKKIDMLKLSTNFFFKKQELNKINKKLNLSNKFNRSLIIELTKKYNTLCYDIDIISNFTNQLDDIIELIKLFYNQYNDKIINEIKNELNIISNKLNIFEFNQIFSGKYDYANCYVDIQAGSGGIEAQDWASMLLKMYLRWAELHKFKTNIIYEMLGEKRGIKSVTIKIIGRYAYGWLRTETGIHRLVRQNPISSSKRRHTSFSSLFVYPDIYLNTNIILNKTDLKIDVYRSSGAGGQHVNKTESAVRITHLPTKIVVQCQNSRSQYKNKLQALKQLKIKLYQLEIKKQYIKQQHLENNKLKINWGNHIRSYVIDNSLIKDMRTGLEIRNVQYVLNGNLDKFIKASLKAGL
ncbi:MAG: peptide chain release factor 2 [Candidatus Lightella neohaematopini]|nr:peptide chain release factor 2 [Candidatus Lightella neohaematopini]MCV2528723.1 peptide chain release factor 2 [Candidatus Lightella neohaematopini]